MFKSMKQKICLFCINKSQKYMEQDNINAIHKALKWLKYSVYFADAEERRFLSTGLNELIYTQGAQ